MDEQALLDGLPTFARESPWLVAALGVVKYRMITPSLAVEVADLVTQCHARAGVRGVYSGCADDGRFDGFHERPSMYPPHQYRPPLSRPWEPCVTCRLGEAAHGLVAA